MEVEEAVVRMKVEGVADMARLGPVPQVEGELMALAAEAMAHQI
jgi:hypothetical protein